MAKKAVVHSKNEAKRDRRAYVKQQDVPSSSLDDALRVPEAILDHYAGKSISPLYVAKALDLDPKGSQFRLLAGASIAFGLIDGGAQAASISVTELAKKILRPKTENEASEAKRQAVLAPRVFGDFLTKYNGSSFPRQDLAVNVLEDMGVPRGKCSEVFERIRSSAESVGFLVEIRGKKHVSIDSAGSAVVPSVPEKDSSEDAEAPPDESEFVTQVSSNEQSNKREEKRHSSDTERRKKVFITHGKNRDVVEPIKKLLEFGELTPIVSTERQSVSKPVPEKVMDDMRSCGAAIIHVDVETTITDVDGNEHTLINPNVLIEIGAAMAFYGRRFVLLVRDGIKLPSNLQGLYEVRYAGDAIDAGATIKLLEAIRDIKNYALPAEILPSLDRSE